MIHKRVFQNLKNSPKIEKKNVHLQSVNGNPLSVEGAINLNLEISGQKLNQLFYVVSNMNRNVILGRDWLLDNGVRLYYDLGCLRVGKVYTPLEEDIHISSIVRLAKNHIIKPQSVNMCLAKTRNNSDFIPSELLQISAVDSGFISTEPGLMISNAVVKLNKQRKIPILIVNNTNKTYNLRRGCVIGKIEKVKSENVVDFNNRNIQSKSEQLQESLKENITVPEEHRFIVEKLIERNKDLFAEKDSELGQTDIIKMKIDTGNHDPVKLKPYRTPMHKREIVDKAIDEMLGANIISRSHSPWSFPIVVVDKKDGSKRFCVDFRALNRITKKISYPLPLIDDLLAQVGNAKYFSSYDLKSGYWQVLMENQDKEKTAFACHRGLFQFNVMPFGLVNAPAIFSQLISVALQGCEQFAVAYLDDILVFSKTLEEHLQHCQAVFDKLRKHHLKLKLKKCSFLQTETKYLGFVITQNGIKPDQQKVDAIRSLPKPTTVKQIRSFLGLANYYRRFVPNFSKIAEPLVNLTKKYAKYNWTNACDNAFQALKDNLTAVPLLGYPDLNKPYILYTDASDTCVGACLTQKCDDDKETEKPLYFLSHKLSVTQCKWSTIEKEAFAIHYALQKLDFYLHNATFVIKCDHKPLKYILSSPIQNRKIALWALGISGYNCTIEYITGQTNYCADLLSRIPHTENQENEREFVPDVSENTFEINTFNSNRFVPKHFASCEVDERDIPNKEKLQLPGYNMEEEQEKDAEIVKIKHQIQSGKATSSIQNKHLIIDNVLYYISKPDGEPIIRLYVPSHLHEKVTVQYHDSNGHLGIDKTFDAIRQKYYWPNLYKQLYSYVTTCITCQTRNLKKNNPPVQETDIPPYPFAKIALDLSGPYPETLSGNKYIISFIDLYSGWPEAYPVKDKTAETVAHLLIDEIFVRFGAPLSILSDNGSENVNRVMKETCETLNIHHITTSYYHPKSNGRVERFHRTLHDVLSKKIEDNIRTWDLYLNQSLAAIRFNISESSKFSPFYLLYNRDPVLPLDNLLKPHRRYLGEEQHKIALQHQHKSFVNVHRYMKQAKRRQAKYANKNVKDEGLEVGSPVYCKNHLRKSKLEERWKPYYRIIEQTSPVSFIIKNQLDGTTTKAHAEHLRLAKIDEWELPQTPNARKLRKAAYVVPPESSSEENSERESDEELPLIKIAKRYRRERNSSSSSDEENIPLMELKKIMNEKQKRANLSTESSNAMSDSNENCNLSSNNESDMSINCTKFKRCKKGRKFVSAVTTKQKQTTFKSNVKKEKVKRLVDALTDIL